MMVEPYPNPIATYEDIVASRSIFMESLKNLHASMGTKFMIPIVGGKDLDLFRLFVEVTSRGGIAKVVNERKWKEVTAVFSFPSSATNASFILRKYYVSLLYHYEQMYLFKAKHWTTSPTDALHNVSTITSPPIGSPQHQPNIGASMPEAGSLVCGVIDGKFESGYLITVKIGMEELKGVLYEVPNSDSSAVKMGRRKRRKKCEMRKRDPAHPKPNRSGYNFFFAEQHAMLKPQYHGRDREISRIIGQSWNNLQQPQRAVYQEKALKDKERYKMEMEGYRERLRSGQIMASPVPIGLNSNNPQFVMTSDDDDVMELKNVNIEVLADDEAFDLETKGDKTLEKKNGEEDGISVPIEETDVMMMMIPSDNGNESVPSS